MFSKDLYCRRVKSRACLAKVNRVKTSFQHHYSYITATAPIHAFLGFFLPVLSTTFFPCNCLLFNITIGKTMDGPERGMNPVAISVIDPYKEHSASWGSNQWPVLKSCSLLTVSYKNPAVTLRKRPFHNTVGKGEIGCNNYIFIHNFFNILNIVHFNSCKSCTLEWFVSGLKVTLLPFTIKSDL